MLIFMYIALFELVVWPHEMEPRFHSWYKGRVDVEYLGSSLLIPIEYIYLRLYPTYVMAPLYVATLTESY